MSNLKVATILAKLQDIFWPIERSEIKLFAPLGLMMLCMLFNFGALRSIKDSLVVPNIGAEVISFLKLWLVLPSTIIFTLIYVKLSNICNYEYLFYLIVSFFLGFFILFTYVIFPQQHLFHPDETTINNLVTIYPSCKWFIKIIGKWSYALMYVFCELWSVVIINLLFWQYANHIFDTKSAKRFYPFLGFIGNFGLIMAGNVLVHFSDLADAPEINLPLYYTKMHFQSVKVLQPIMNLIIVAGIVVMIIYAYIEHYVLHEVRIKQKKIPPSSQLHNSLSFRESIKLLMHSKYIGHIVLLVLCYGFLINILEGPWKSKVRELYPNTIDYINFMGQFNIWMGISSVLFMVIGSNILRKFSWVQAALMTPYMLTTTGLVFFVFVIFDQYINFGSSFNPLYIAVLIGAIQNILSKSTKYSLFDSTKEMAYIPLSFELKTKGKAAVEVIGLKFGKSLGAFVQSFLFIIMPMATFDSIAIYLLAIFIVVMALWIWNVKQLGREYLTITGSK
ncbi:MAG: Npt1/Npt2 family nucleotide transporter [Rickettsiaceae bacterium]